MTHDPYKQQLDEARQIWNSEAASFDNEPDHGLRDPQILATWTGLLRGTLPALSASADVLDIGCGTGSLSLVLASLGCRVTGIDFSPEMILRAKAKAKAAGQAINFRVMDAAFPHFPPRQFDAILCRHVLWALSEPDKVLRRWVGLLKPQGRLILIEGFWHTGAGLRSQAVLDALPTSLINVSVQSLSHQTALWGGEVDDERYLLLADLRA